VTHQPSATVPKDRVINTAPPAGSSVARGSTINIVESSGPAKVPVPNVVGQSEAQAISALTQAHLGYTVEKGHDSAYGPGQVFRQSPLAHTPVAQQTAVKIWVNSNAATLKVPSWIIGYKQDAATQVLSSLPYDYVVTPVIAQGGSGGPNEVYGTNPSAGSPLPKGSPITIYVNPPAPTQSPTPTPSSSSPSPTASPTPSSSSSSTPPSQAGAVRRPLGRRTGNFRL
jgi:serine/threonine-protein kinase